MNEILVLAVAVVAEYIILKRCMESLKEIVSKHKVKGKEERYAIFWKKNRIKFAIGLVLTSSYSTFITCYPILNCNNMHLEKVWSGLIASMVVLELILPVVLAYSSKNKKLQTIRTFLLNSWGLLIILYEPILIVLISYIIGALPITFITQLLPTILILANMATIMDICKGVESVAEAICKQIESKAC